VVARIAARYIEELQMPGGVAVTAAAAVLLVAAIAASVVPAARAARTNVTRALRAE
jgi:ABC-type lipoprotein release transport system permease subunit